jgi:thiol:disulfide interchange protein DsbD
MKKILIMTVAAVMAISANSQVIANPVSWTFSSKKVADKTYELHLTANLQPGWHMYSQTQPDDAIPQPTLISFNKNPLLTLAGKAKEDGKMEKFTDPNLGSANQYSTKVDFVQTVKLKANAKTNVTGSVKFQTCDNEKCLPPKTVSFNVAL